MFPEHRPFIGSDRHPRLSPPSAEVWIVVCICLVASLELSWDPRVSVSPASTPVLASSGGSAAEKVAAAQDSLERGAGPAAGVTMSCVSSSNSDFATCDSFSSPGASASAADALPGARSGAAMTWDGRDDYVLLFSGSSHDDTWEFADGTWTDITPNPITATNSPPGAVGAGLTYDAKDGYVVLFGGAEHPGKGRVVYSNQTWEFAGGFWKNITDPTDSPPARAYLSMSYDSQEGYVLLFGGGARDGFLGDTWSFASGVWTNLTPRLAASPPCLFDAALSNDPADDSVILYGGVGKRVADCDAIHENITRDFTWSFHDGEWENLTASAGTPPLVWGESMAYDPASSAVVLFGGVTRPDVANQETWQFVDGLWSLTANTSYPPLSPPGRFGACLAYDNLTASLILFGGLSEPQRDAPVLGDVWSYSDGAWTNLTPAPWPPYRASMAMTYDAKDQYVLLFGGNDANGPLGDTWKYERGSWLELYPPLSPPPRYDASMTYDTRNGYEVLFGGLDDSGYLGDTWVFEKGLWTNLTPTTRNATNSPSPRDLAALEFDAARSINSVILFGGRNSSGPLNDTWSFNAGSWVQLQPSQSPSARWGAGLAYDVAIGSGDLVLFGGASGSTTLGDTWEFNSVGTWAPIPTPLGAPSPRSLAAFVYDATDGYLLLFGGVNGSVVLGDTWTFASGTWTKLTVSPSPGPTDAAGAAYDATDSLVLLFGGATAGSNLQDSTWIYRAGTWTLLANDPINADAA